MKTCVLFVRFAVVWSATPVSSSAASDKVSALATVVLAPATCADAIIEQEKDSVVIIANTAISFFITINQ